MIWNKITKIEKKGLYSGVISPFLYSIDSVLDILLFAVIFGANYKETLSIWQTVCYSFITSLFKDFLLFIFMHLKAKNNIIKVFMQLAYKKKRAFWWTIFGSISGGPLGFTLTTATILYSGAAYGSALSNFSPIVVLLFARFFLKTKLNFRSWIGVCLAIIGFLGISFYSSLVKNDSFAFNLRIFIGVIMAICAVITWSVETIVAEYVEKFGKEQSLSDNEKLTIKSVSSSISITFGFLPISLLFAYVSNQYQQVTSMLSEIFQLWQGWLILIIIGLVIVAGRFAYWYAISHIGGGRADVLYYLTVLIVPLLVLILYAFNVTGFSQPPGVTLWIYWTFLSAQMTGVFLVSLNTKNSK